MCRVLLLLVFVTYAAASCGHSHHDYKPGHRHYHGRHHHYGRHGRHYDHKFDSIARDLIDADRKALKYCNDNNEETYDSDRYRLVNNLDSYDVKSIVVKAKYRVLQIKAEKLDTREEYNEIRILPSIVDIGKGSWEYLDGMLNIRFAYREDTKSCSIASEDEVTIPMKEENFEIDVRFSEIGRPTKEGRKTTETPMIIEENLINEKAQ